MSPPIRIRHVPWRHFGGTALILATLIATFAAMPPRDGQDLGVATLLVQVVDETGTGISNQEVYVVISDGEEVVEEFTGNTTLGGVLRFNDISVGAQYTVSAVTLFQGYPYRSLATPLAPGVEAVIPLGVFTVGPDATNLHINILHIIINVLQPGVYQVIQLLEVLNPGETAGYTAEALEGRQIGLVIPVPSMATNIAPVEQIAGLDSDNLSLNGNRLLDFRPVPPGTHQMVIQYELHTGAGGADIELTIPYPTAQVTVLAGPGLDAVEINSDQLAERPPATDIPGGPFAYWESDVFSSGDTLHFRLGPRRPLLSTASWSLLGLAVALFASTIASIWGGRPSDTPRDRARLVAEIAQLDQAYDSGNLSDSDYHARRAETIEHLMQIQRKDSTNQSIPGE